MTKSNLSVEYRDIPEFPGYRVGNDGSVWSCWKRGCKPSIGTNWKKLKPAPNADGGLHLNLRRDGKTHTRLVHRIVLESFIGPCQEGHECAHYDGDPSNNHLNNLRWTTPTENHADKIRHGTTNRGERCGASKLTENQVLEIRLLRKQKIITRIIGERFGISQQNVCDICNRKTWSHLKE